MNAPEAQSCAGTPGHARPRYGLWILLIALLLAVVALAGWLWRPRGQSPFIADTTTNGDPLETVFQLVLLRLVKESPLHLSRAMAKLAEASPPTQILKSTSASGGDSGKGEWFSDQRRLIRCSPEVAEEIASNFQIWSAFVAQRAGAKAFPGHWSCEGGLVTAFDFRYEFARHQGIVRATMKRPKTPVAAAKNVQYYESLPDVYELHWEIKESCGSQPPTWTASTPAAAN